MRRWGSILLELITIGAASGGLILAVQHYSQRSGGTAEPPLGLVEGDTSSALTPPPVSAALLAPPPVVVAEQALGTFLGISDEIALDHLRVQPVAAVRPNRGGSSISLRVTFASGARAAFKPQQTNPQTVPRKEVAAYRLNRWLGLRAVPPATMRTIHREDLFGKLSPEARATAQRMEREVIFDKEGFTRGEVSYWIPVVADSHLDTDQAVIQWSQWLTIGQEIPADKRHLMEQLSTLLVFDLLQNNSDRFSGGNLLTSPDGKTLFYMDNTFGFQVEPEGHEKCRNYLKRVQKFSRRLVARLRQLDLRALRQALMAEPAVLNADEMRAVIARRDAVLRYVDGLIAKNGAERVLVFP